MPTYCEQAACGKVDGHALPTVASTRPGIWVADARDGFAHPAIDVGFARLVPSAREQGIAALAIINSYNCGVVGHHVERLALQGLVALAFANTPAAIAPWGGNKALFGTNPLAFAAPRREGPPLVVDQSASVVARGEVMLHALQGQAIPSGWALDRDGVPTTDPHAALAGSMLPAGGYKGASIALMVEILAAALAGATFSFNASSFADTKVAPAHRSAFIAFDPAAFLGERFADRIESLIQAMTAQPGVRLPGAKRIATRAIAAAQGVTVPKTLFDRVQRLLPAARQRLPIRRDSAAFFGPLLAPFSIRSRSLTGIGRQAQLA